MLGETVVELGLHLALRTIGVGKEEQGVYAVVGLALESLNLALAVDDESYGHALHTSGGEGGLHLAPQYGRHLEAHEAVEHATGLLRVHQVHIEVAWVLDGLHDGGLGNFVEHDARGLLLVESEHFAKVPTDGFSFAVLIGCQPNSLGCFRVLLQIGHHLGLLLGNLVGGLKGLFVYAEFFLL